MFTDQAPVDITSANDILSLVVSLPVERIRFQSYALFGTLMRLVDNNDRLWHPARLSMKGVHSPTKSIPAIPPIEDPEDVLDFLRFHVSPQQIPAAHEEPIFHAFRSIVVDSNAKKRRGVAAYDKLGSSSLADAMIQLLGKKDFARLRKMSLLALPELDSLLFTSEAAFNDPNDPEAAKRAEDLVKTWSTAINEFLPEETPEIEVAVVQVLLAIANLPSLRVWLRPEQWTLAYKFPTILYLDSPSMERCTQNPTIFPSIKQSDGDLMGWVGMSWMKYHSLSTEVRRQLEEETRAIGRESAHSLNKYIGLFDFEIEQLNAKIIKPLHPASQELWKLLADMNRAKDVLVQIKEEGEREQEEVEQQRAQRSHLLQQQAQSSSLSGGWGLAKVFNNSKP